MIEQDYTKNYERYEGIIKRPYEVNGVKIYEVEFLGLNELYDFLMSNPPLNDFVFSSFKSHGDMDDKYFAEFYQFDYSKALEYLHGGYAEENIERMFELKKLFDAETKYYVNNTRVVKSFTGSRICINGFISNSPKKFYRLERMEEKKFVTIHINMSFSIQDVKSAVVNRGVLLKNFIDMLENNNYSVRLNSFMFLGKKDEAFYLKIHLKDNNSNLYLDNIMYPLTSNAFLRRLVFRVMESVPFQIKDWNGSYGGEVTEEDIKNLLKIPDKDICIGTPTQIGLKGNSLEEDAVKFLDYVDVGNYVRVMKK